MTTHGQLPVNVRLTDERSSLAVYDQTWIEEGEPVVMWLSGLHIPESYLTAMVQTTCRLKNWPLDKSTLYTVVTKYVDPGSVRHTAPLGALRTHDTPTNRKGTRVVSKFLSVANPPVICFW
jgi:hypothetical protein